MRVGALVTASLLAAATAAPGVVPTATAAGDGEPVTRVVQQRKCLLTSTGCVWWSRSIPVRFSPDPPTQASAVLRFRHGRWRQIAYEWNPQTRQLEAPAAVALLPGVVTAFDAPPPLPSAPDAAGDPAGVAFLADPPAAWPACEPVDLWVDTTAAVAAGLDAAAAARWVTAAAGAWAQATGYRMAVTTDPAAAEVTVTFADPAAEAVLAGPPAGYTTTAWVTRVDAAGRVHRVMAAAAVLLDAPALAANPAAAAVVAAHELGHALGLAHTASPGQVMAAALPSAAALVLGAGDVAGGRALAALQCPRRT